MTAGMPTPALRRRLLGLLAGVPPGRVVRHGLLARELGIDPRLAASLLAMLDAGERQTAPWHRAVADGGAIGRHAWRDLQMRLLAAEGTPVSPAGIVQDMGGRAVTTLDGTATAIAPAADGPGPGAGRARGSKGQPRSSLP